MKYKIQNELGEVINTIVATQEFVETTYPGRYEQIPEPEVQETPIRVITKLAFRRRFTQAEKIDIYTAAETDIAIKVWLDDLAAAEEIDLDDADLIVGVQYLESEGIIASGRAVEILT